MRKITSILTLLIMSIAMQSCNEQKEFNLTWQQLPQIPDEVGFAGSLSGISNDHLIVAGGSNFPAGTRPWSGGVKYWSDKIFALKKGDDKWKEVGVLPRPIGYSISLTWKDGIVVLGGADQKQHYADAFILKLVDDKVVIDSLPAMPAANSNACGVIINDVVYVAGGLSSPTAKSTEKLFWSLDLSKPAKERAWQVLDTWAGESRMLGVAGAINDEFYLVSGVHLKIPTDDTTAHREYLKDAYRYNTKTGWKKISDLPYSVTAAPSPAFTYQQKDLVIFGGDDGSRAELNAVLKDDHPGFRTEILSYSTENNAWSKVGDVLTNKQPDPQNTPNASTWAPVTTPLVIWDGNIVIPGGEVRPGVRTNRVLVAKP